MRKYRLLFIGSLLLGILVIMLTGSRFWFENGLLGSETIERLRSRGLLIGAITNGSSLLQNAKLDLSGLRPHLDIAAVGEDEGIQKPDPRLFRRIAARLGLPCAACLYVGDNPGNDIAGALAAGMRPVWIDRGFAAGHPSYARPVPPQVPVIHSLAGLDTLT